MRMTFKRNSTEASDFDLTIWHLPSEKMFGFRSLFRNPANSAGDYRSPAGLGFRSDVYRSAMGIPVVAAQS